MAGAFTEHVSQILPVSQVSTKKIGKSQVLLICLLGSNIFIYILLLEVIMFCALLLSMLTTTIKHYETVILVVLYFVVLCNLILSLKVKYKYSL